ncbi:hypothetical protein FA15DRAFT_586164 [Coprinopsis marcescibilis]|uniref:Uncharacterized protein n=1 Tax=Coprinopsis marcescibilis TaxID=230819 RepID=A0A5C3L4K7_COPMA|nr:hypothetical protein FA15DRAFT_586164 [Coprinopsis marcescibilis]
MPTYLASYEDTAPYFNFTGDWKVGRSTENRFIDHYSESSFIYAPANSSSATLSFEYYGTTVSIHGSRLTGRDAYRVFVDGRELFNSSNTTSTDRFNATIFSAALPLGHHKVELSANGSFVDVDYVSWSTNIGENDEDLIVNTIQDMHPDFEYDPPGEWVIDPPHIGSFAGASGHATSRIGASATLSFTGDAIALFGPSGPQFASSYSVAINNTNARAFSALKPLFRSKQLLYYGANLGLGNHSLTITLDQTVESDHILAIDYAEVYSTPSMGGRYVIFTVSNRLEPPSGLVAGLTVTSAIAAIALLILLHLFFMYRKGRFVRASEAEVDRHFGAFIDPHGPVVTFSTADNTIPVRVVDPATNMVLGVTRVRDSTYTTGSGITREDSSEVRRMQPAIRQRMY